MTKKPNTNSIKISLQNVSKTFEIKEQKQKSALSQFVLAFKSPFKPISKSKKTDKRFIKAVDKINIDVYEGESLGIIGRNGSGKSTLLRLIAEIHNQDEGEILRNGKVIYISGFTHGLKPKLTMRDNIFLVASILGLNQDKIQTIFNEIVEFSGLQEFIDTKIYTFSSGMVARLAFAIGLHVLETLKPDIILFDEVIGVGGDIDFMSKANARMNSLIQGTTTVIFVSHSLQEIQKYCTRVLWMEKGGIRRLGDTEVVVAEYVNFHTNTPSANRPNVL